MAATTRIATTPIANRRSLVAELASAVAASLARARSAIGSVVDGAQLGPAPHTTDSRWSGGRI